MTNENKNVPLLARVYELECRLSEVIRRLDMKHRGFADMVVEPLSAWGREEVLDPTPKEAPKVIVGGYYKTISGQRAHATFREPDECEPMITGHVLRDDAVRCVSWTLEGLSYGSPDDNIRLSTYQPQPFEE